MRESRRFTLDGSDALEEHLEKICDKVLAGVCAIVPNEKLEGLLLGGGYGRGEGGVLKTETGDQPYNDLEFFILLRGSCWLNEKKYLAALHELSEQLSPEAGVEIEFKILSLRKLEQSPVTMSFYDLVSGHRRLWGTKDLLRNCDHHRAAEKIPLCEATRLLMNRCSGLLFAKTHLQREPLTPESADFVGRNHAKAQLAFGDVILTAHKLYHWSCRERWQRLQKILPAEELPWLGEVRRHHCLGAEFKLYPQRQKCPRETLMNQQAQLSVIGLQLWIWLENRRLGGPFFSSWDYAASIAHKCPETNPLRNLLINARTFGPAALFKENAVHYPRARLFHALAALLWEMDGLANPFLLKRVQTELRTSAKSFPDLVCAYQTLWRRFN